ncbi:NACHT domain-containing protein [Streptomyces sp. CT34]|uniref:NACHT domain-containing protein n=1 Tax=Streptomyces sp. CT34 TaxID=1553907 RepID=UPI0005BD6741|nr:NACHT domain-containing protein [Streptomyces sp. CT34]
MEPTTIGLRIASSVCVPLVKRLFRQDGPGAGLVERAVRVSGLVSFRGEKRTLSDSDLRKLTGALVERAQRAVGPHDRYREGEHAAVTDAVCRTLYGLGELDMDDVQAVGLGPERFARRLRAQAPDACRELSKDGARFHDRLVDTASVHILHFFTQRSTFVARTLVEQSRRIEEVIGLLDRLPPPQSAADAAFEAEYADSLVKQHSQVTIVGVDFANSPDSWSLDATYLSLGVEFPEGEPDHSADGPVSGTESYGPQPPVPVEHALAGQERVLLRGIAGSGKTTVVQWLAVSTAKQQLPAELNALRGRVPFVLPVRRFSDRDLPLPVEFLSAARHPLSGAEPDAWPLRVLRSGRGLMLIDGIDEAPAERREKIRTELDQLLRQFPGNVWLVTSRPAAVRPNWLAAQGFGEMSLAPMNRDQVARFIRSWHAAAASDVGRDHARLPDYERKLLHSVRLIRELRRLAANPLMCGLICALNRDRNGILPRGRKALYKAALAMLLERRDPEREVDADGIVLDREAKERLLQKLAHWMLLNDRTELDRRTAVEILARFLPAIPSAGEQGTAEELFDHLLHRTGLLRIPAPGSVDFVHRTFQDYLSAKEAVERHDFPFLVNNAHRSDWDEVIRMAVSLARPDECATMIENLVSPRPGLPAAKAKYCKLLAAACLEHATEMSPQTRAIVRQRTRFLVQPDTIESARGLGWIGPIALELLPEPDGTSDHRALLLAATACGIRDDAAIDYLARLRSHRSLAVRAELAAAWRRFDTERYATEIIAHLDPEGLYFTVTDRTELAELRRLGGRERIRVAEQLTPEELVDGLVADRLTHLHLVVYDTRRDLDWLSAFPRLTTLRLGRLVGAVHGVPERVRIERDGVSGKPKP